MERDKALEMAMSQIERQFGKGAIMKMGDSVHEKMASISTGALWSCGTVTRRSRRSSSAGLAASSTCTSSSPSAP